MSREMHELLHRRMDGQAKRVEARPKRDNSSPGTLATNTEGNYSSGDCSNVCFFKFLATPRGMWDLCSLTRDRTCALCIKRAES